MEFERKVVELDVNDVLPNRFQPRIKFNEDSINELSDSIKEHGVIQPIVVRAMGDKYEIIAGERRYKASLLAGKTTIPAVITNLNDKDSAEVALIENVQRKDLTPIEEAISYKKILDMGYLTQEELAVKLGKSQSTVANKLRLLNLDEDVQEAVLDEKISERHARSLLKLNDFNSQKKILNSIIENRWTVRKTDDEIAKLLNSSSDDNVNVLTPTFSDDNPFKVKRVEPEKMVVVEENKPNKFLAGEPIVIMDSDDQMPVISEDDIAMLLGSDTSISSPTTMDPILGIPTAPIENSSSEPAAPVINPGFMNIDSIETNAKDISQEPKAPANIDSLVQSAIPTPVVNEEKEELKAGKFFDLPTDDEETDNKNVAPTTTEQNSLSDAFNFELNMVGNTTPVFEPSIPTDMNVSTTSSVNKIENLMNTASNMVSEPSVSEVSNDSTNTFNIDDLIPSPVTLEENVLPAANSTATASEVLSLDGDSSTNTIGASQMADTLVVPTFEEKSSDDMPVPSLNQPVSFNNNISGALNDVRNLVSNMEKEGYLVDSEELDFEGEYQFIIKVKK